MAREMLLRGGYVVRVDDSLRDLPNGDVLIRDDQVAAVGRNLSTSTRDAEVLDVAGRLVIPGLVDTHRHVWQGAIGAFTPQMTGAGYGPAVLNGISTSYAPEDIYAAPCGEPCRRLTPASRRSRTGRTICGRPNMRTPIFAVCRNRGSAAIFFMAARGRRPTCRTHRIRSMRGGCGTSISQTV
jgi:hypothetical protein